MGRDEACIIAVKVDFEGVNDIGNYGNVFR